MGRCANGDSELFISEERDGVSGFSVLEVGLAELPRVLGNDLEEAMEQ